MDSRSDFVALVSSAYQHLYDFVQLRTQALGDLLLVSELSSKERSWQLHRLLIDVIDDRHWVVGGLIH